MDAAVPGRDRATVPEADDRELHDVVDQRVQPGRLGVDGDEVVDQAAIDQRVPLVSGLGPLGPGRLRGTFGQPPAPGAERLDWNCRGWSRRVRSSSSCG
jgi:hypothetical protein